MIYSFPDLMSSNPEAATRAMESGVLSRSHLFIDLPKEFDFKGETPPTVKPGLGDMVASIAQPIARAFDSALGTNIAHCGSCLQRKEALNEAGKVIGIGRLTSVQV